MGTGELVGQQEKMPGEGKGGGGPALDLHPIRDGEETLLRAPGSWDWIKISTKPTCSAASFSKAPFKAITSSDK